MAFLIRWAALAAAALLAAASASAAEKRYGLTSFEAIELNADVTVEVVTRAPVSAVATGSPDALDRLTVETRDGRLVIGQKIYAGDEARRQPLGAVTLRVNAANLRSATVVGGGSLQIDTLKGTKVTIGLRGPGRLTVGTVTSDRLTVAMIGNGTMVLAGQAKTAQMTLSGAGAVDAGDLKIDELVSDSEGTGDHIFHAVKSAAVTSRGLGRVTVLGKPLCTVRNVGAGTVQCGARK
ncbi:head GIN domain-containing protein [Sphingopyxis sp. PET50]|uniref:head GIN domain-containing protein n=1 Tax=Sphingopyxis sp. PET50 TaxID=2976533 RepID=UPI0021AEDD69|nr:head GIN domain-containing protein [Sphingopyxis sp. PET50]